MTVETFLANFERLAEAPNGIAQLRELVLQLAVRGKLVPQDPEEEPASELLKKIQAEKEQLIAEGCMRKPKPLPPIEQDEVVFNLPSGWEWIRIGSAMHMINGRAFKPTEWSQTGKRIVRIQNLNNPTAQYNHCNEDVDERFHIDDGDFLISWSGTPGTSFGAFVWNRGTALLNQHIFRCLLFGGFSKEYLRLAINAVLDEMIAQAHGGVGLRHITKGKLERLIITLPPHAEQKRIVAKVDELMAQCDDLEAKQQAKRTKQLALNRASLHALTQPNGTSLAVAWHRIRDHFDDLYTVPETVAELRQTILQLAVMGCLVPQDHNDEPASELLKKIQAEKQRLIAEGKIRKPKPLPPVESDEMPSKLPGCWLWTRLDELIVAGPKNGYSPKPVDFETPVKTLTLSAVTRGTFDESCFKYVDLEADAVEKYWLEDGDLLVQRSNTPEYVGVSAVYRGPKKQFMFPDLIMRVRLTESVWLEYVHLAMLGQAARGFLRERASGTSSSMVKINQTALRMTPIPLPSLAEQKCVVAKADQLMTLCDDLEAKLQQAQTDAGNLLTAIVYELMGKSAGGQG